MRLLVVLLAPVLLAAAKLDWTYVSSPNFELYTTAGPREARGTIEHYEQVRDFFMRAKSSAFTTQLPVTIIAFRNIGEYRSYAPNASASAFYFGDKDRDYIVMSNTGSESYSVAVHEYMHLLLRHSVVRVPPWLDEGMAEVYSTLKSLGGKAQVGAIPELRAQTLQRESWLPAKVLLEVTQASPEYNDGSRAGIFYAQSWLLAHMLMLDDRFQPKFNEFLQAVSSGTPSLQAFARVWNVSAEQLDRLLREYFSLRRLRSALYDLPLQRFSGFEPRPADPPSVEAHLAMLAAFLGRKEEAMNRLYHLARQYPDRWKVRELLAILAWRGGDMEGAQEYFRQATGLNPPDWKIWWAYARLMHGVMDEDETAIRALRRTIELNPSHVEARIMLGEEYAYARRYKESIETLSAVSGTPRELEPRLYLAIAYANTYAGNDLEARKAALRAKEIALAPSETARAQEILHALDVRARASSVPPLQEQPLRLGRSRSEGPVSTLTGVLKAIDCLGTQARLQVETAGGVLALIIRDSSQVSVQGRTESTTLNCGSQPRNVVVTIEYLPREDRSAGTIGDVRSLSLK